MKKFIKTISYFYILFLAILLLIPLDLFFATQIIEEESQPSNSTSYIIHIMLFFIHKNSIVNRTSYQDHENVI